MAVGIVVVVGGILVVGMNACIAIIVDSDSRGCASLDTLRPTVRPTRTEIDTTNQINNPQLTGRKNFSSKSSIVLVETV